ncbi:biosynthetic-type acetolactate synthase large subunit [uncultured Bilophila sp.]|uniref:biosynthetic-type acetolactate synthase large subunit n=3 Tax=uncultured Bilophila sp. TaxID=529385 RepID=UPI0025D75127|nr:biosynthetic-type acetolactate synthase large subunit [uncultured Bilophila sp.]
MVCTGARIFLESLKREGVDLFFGYPGGAVIDIYNELSSHPDIRHILVRHEQGAVHAADGYARASGKVGVCLATSGPGATNTVTGIATAYSDSIPLVIFTGQVSTPLIGNDAFQEVDIVGITRPCTKHNFLVKDVKDLALTIRKAFYLARSGRPGPVLVDIPKNIQQATCDYVWPENVSMRSYCPTYRANLNQLRRAMDVLVTSRKLLVMAGGGVIMADAAEELTMLARRLHAPVTSTLMGLGAFPGDDPQWIGMLGMHGTYAANRAVTQADVILAVGARFDDRVTGKLSTFAPNARIVHIDIDPTTLRKNVRVEVPVVSDALSALQGLRAILESGHAEKDWEGAHAEWNAQVREWQERQPLSWARGETLKPQQVVEALYRMTEGKAVITTEVGQNQMWAAQFYKYHRPRTYLTSGGLGTMGYGLPAAIGAQLAFPDRLVVDVAGDGSIQMNSQELMTAVENELPVKILILNNRYLGMVRQWQELFYDTNYVATDMKGQPDFVKLADAYGAEGYRITTEEELEEILPRALASPKTAIIDVWVDREENVSPIVPTGASLDEMLIV